MANNTFLVSLLVLLQLLCFSTAQTTVKGGYWYSDAGLAASDIDSTLFTHLFCAFADLDTTTNQVTISPSNAQPFSTFTQTVQQKNPSVKTLLSLGGGGGPTLAGAFATMANEASTRKSFIDSSIEIARANNFDGLDLDWEYPFDADKTNYGLLIKEWREAVKEESRTSGKAELLLTAAVAGSDQISSLDSYPIEEISQNFDWVNAMVYDLFIPEGYPTETRPPAPLKNPAGLFSGDQGISKWIELGLSESKIALGLPFYGYTWQLVSGDEHGLFAAASSGGGSIGYGNIVRDYLNKGAQKVYNGTFVTDYCYSGATWIGYDDTESVTAKVDYAKGRGLAGYFAWQLGGDDDDWTLSKTASNAWGA